jgi:hypothetical protein
VSTVYTSRSRTTRTRLLIGAGVAVLVLLGFLAGQLFGGDDPAPAAAPPPPPPPSSAVPEPEPSSAPPPVPADAIDAYQPLQVESADAISGTEMQDTEDEGGGQNAGWINNGDSLRFDDVNFGDQAPAQLNVRVASEVGGDGGGRVEIRIDSPTAEPAAVLRTTSTGGWQKWRTEATDMKPVTGVHTVFVTFGSDRPDDFLNVNWLVFRR